MIEQKTFPIFSFSEALEKLKAGFDIERRGLRLRIINKTIMMVVEGDEIICPWLPTHGDLLANDWVVISIG